MYGLICALSFFLSFVLVPPVIAVAWRIGAVDVPCDARRMHCVSIPRAGGIGIYVSFFLACLVLGSVQHEMACVLAGGFLMMAIGLADDIFCLQAWTKLFFQIAIATATVLGSGMASGISSVMAVAWVVMLTNAHNFVDGLDGLLSGCAAIEGALLSLALMLAGTGAIAFYPLLLSLSCLGFRHFNRYPARIFAGDCGSGCVGFLLAMLSLPLAARMRTPMEILSPLFLFAYPLTDLVCAVTRRILRGKSLFIADRAHLHHRIIYVGLTHPQSCGVLLSIAAGLGIIGVLLCREELYAVASIASAVAVLLMMRLRRYVLSFA